MHKSAFAVKVVRLIKLCVRLSPGARRAICAAIYRSAGNTSPPAAPAPATLRRIRNELYRALLCKSKKGMEMLSRAPGGDESAQNKRQIICPHVEGNK